VSSLRSSEITQNEKHSIAASLQARTAYRLKPISRPNIACFSKIQPRVWLYFYGLVVGLLAFSVSGAGIYLGNTTMFITGTFVWLLWFGLMFMICIPSLNLVMAPKIRWFKRGALTLMILFILAGIAELIAVRPIPLQMIEKYGKDSGLIQLFVNFAHSFRFNDGIALTQQAASNFVEGKNPYENANVVTAFQGFGQGSGEQVTPLRVGALEQTFPYPTSQQLDQLWQQAINNPGQVPPEFESKYNYPAGSFLLPAPFLLLGVHDLRIVYLIYTIAALAYVTWLLRKNGWLIFILGVLASLQLWNSTATGETGTLWFALLLVAWISIKKNWWLSALAMGLAATTKQISWFFLPFYLVLIFKSCGLRPLLKMSGVIAGVFLITNLPFIIEGPKLWLASVMAPMMDNMFPTGSGIVSFVLSGFVDIRSSLVFGIIEAIVLIGGAIWYYRRCAKYPHTGLILAILPLFFAWRSIQSYFFCVDIVLLAAIILESENLRLARAIRPSLPEKYPA
jgi:hypothetical protein